IWVETGSYPEPDPGLPIRSPRPAQYDLSSSLALLRDVLAERGLLHRRVGLELGFVPAGDYPAFDALAVAWQDCTRLIQRLRSVKAPLEIEHLRNAAECAGAGLSALIESIEPGMDAARMADIWRTAAL